MSRMCEICGKKTMYGNKVATRGLPKSVGGIGLKTTFAPVRFANFSWKDDDDVELIGVAAGKKGEAVPLWKRGLISAKAR